MIRFNCVATGFTPDMLGYIPQFLNEVDMRPAKEQINDAYAHGGGWKPFQGFKMDPQTQAIKYPGDPAHPVLAYGMLREERINYYESSWVAIVQPDGSYEIARLD